MATAPPTVSVLLQSLRRLRSNARDGTLHEQFFVNGYRYFVEGQARCWWCRHETQEAAAEMLHLFALQPNDNTENYKRALAARLAECDRCVTVYYSAKAALKRRYEDLYDKATVDSVFRAIEAWDVQRIVRRFASSSNERSAVIDALAGTANLLAHREMEDMVCAYVESCQAAGRLLAATVDGSGLLPGVLLLCFSANQRVRGWARQTIKHGAAKDHAAPWEPVLAVLTCVFGAPAAGAAPTTFRFSRDSLWHGLRALFVRLAPDAKRSLVEQLGPLAGPLCRAVLAAEGAEFVDALRVFSDIIGAREAPSVWPAIAQSAKLTPIDFARAVLGRSDVRRLLEVGGDGDFGDSALESCSRRLRPVLGWITPFTGSLDLPGDADALGVLLEELVLVIGTNTRLPAAARALGLHTGVAIIRHCFKLPPGKTLVVESGCFVLDSFLNRHIGMLVDVAQGRGDLSESDLLITGTEDLVDTMVRDDLTWTLKAVSEYGEAALEARACEGVDAGPNHAPPVLLHFPALWQSLLKDLNNTNVLRRALFGASYLLLFDALPDSLSIWLQPAWRDACKRFERLRADMRSHLQRALELLADGLDSVDAASRRGFEQEILPSQLRILVSPAGSVHAAVLRVLRVGPLDGQDEPDIGEAAVGKAPTELTDCERDMACNELFERYQEVFVDGLARIVHDCTVLVKYRRPAQSCCRNTALLVRSLLSIVGGSSPERVLEPLARLFYGLCGLLGSILRESIEANVDKAGSSSGYEGAILTVFRTVYDMLNSAEFVDYVRMAKSSAVVDEDEALDALSTCVSQMFKYLERESDVMGVSERIVRTFGMVASGLAATPGASILYPAKAMGALASGETGCVAATHRPLLRSVLDMPVWQARHVAISERKPLQISIDEVEAFAAMDNLDLTDILDDIAAADVVAIASRPEPNVIIVDSDDRPPRDVVARAAPKAEGSSHPEQPMLAPVPVVEIDGSDDDDEMTEEVTEIQLTPVDAQNARRKQSSMDYWFAAVSTRPAISRPAAAAQAASKPRPKPKPTSGVLGQMRASFAQERRAVLPSRTQLPTIPKQVVKPARALPSVPVETWAARRFDTPLEPPRPAVHIPVRDASRAAIDERRARDIARGKSGTPHASREVSSSDNDDDDDGSGGLAGLIEISRPRDPQAPRRRAIRIAPHASGAGAHLGGGVPTAMQLTRERAAAEERARMRLLPSMAALHKHLLSWRYEDAGDVPPGMEALAAEARVPDRFDDSGRYLAAFEPLLLLECWAQFQRAKEEMTGDDMCEAHLRAHMSESEFRVLTFAVTAADARLLSESDVLVFSEAQSHEKQLAQRSRGGVSDQSSFLAVVHKRQFARDTAQVIVRVHFEGVRLAHQLTRLVLNSAWTFFRLLSLTTVHREFAALRSLPYLDEELVAAILRPRPGLTRALKCAEVRECMQAHALNQPQAEAVVAALRCESGFTLIQGPPGTGKTKTILGLIGALLSAARAGDAATGGAGRLLVCAPSNAAVDEIVRRLMAGIRDSTGGTYQPRVVRVGQLSSVSSTVRESTLDAQLEQALDKQRKSSSDTAKSGEALQTLRKQLDSVNTEIRELDNQLQSIDPVDTAALQAIREQFRSAKGRKRTVCQQLELERARTRDEARAADETRTRLRRQILLGAEVVCTTLSGSGHEALASLGCEYGTVIIDEAAQSVELACLIPLKYECKRCILVGDPNQLPPTVLSRAAERCGYNQSLFVRVQRNAPAAVSLLSIQYRMHPEISALPSRLFYESRLRDGDGMAAARRAPWHSSEHYPPLAFLNLAAGKEQRGAAHSVFNTHEVEAALQLVAGLCRDYPNLAWRQKIGIITPYKQQLRRLVAAFEQWIGPQATEVIEFNTVDGFQGQEKDVVIFSCVRAGEAGVGFLADRRRMNVGLTRARRSLFVLGNAQMLCSSPMWATLVDDVRGRGLLKDVALPLFGHRLSKSPALLTSLQRMSPGADTDGEGGRADEAQPMAIDEEALDSFNAAVVQAQRRRSQGASVSAAPIAVVPDVKPAPRIGRAPPDGGRPMHPALRVVAEDARRRRARSRSKSQSRSRSRSPEPARPQLESVPVAQQPDSRGGDEMRGQNAAVARPHAPPLAVARPSTAPPPTAAARAKPPSSLFIPRKRPKGAHADRPRSSTVASGPTEPPPPIARPPPLPPGPPPPPRCLPGLSVPFAGPIPELRAQPPLPSQKPSLLPPSASTRAPHPRPCDRSRSRSRSRRKGSRSPSQKRHDDSRSGRGERERRNGASTSSRGGRSKHSASGTSESSDSSKRGVPKKRVGGLFRPSAEDCRDAGRRKRKGRGDEPMDREDIISDMLRK